MTVTAIRTSADDAAERLDTPTAAAKYARALNDTATHRREMRCVLRALRGVNAGAQVLDLPCGTRQWYGMLERE